MKHLFIVNPVAGKQKPEDKLRLINEAIDRLPAEQRERDKMLKRAERKVKDAEEEIARIEQEIADVEARISAGEVEPEIFDTHAALNKKLDNAMSLWELATIELEDFKKS